MTTTPTSPAQSDASAPSGRDTVRRRRGTALEGAVLRAAWDELAAVGFEDLTFEGIATRARTSRAVLYRRWPSLSDLVLAAMSHQAPPPDLTPPDTGDLRGDILALLGRVTRRLAELAPVLQVIAAERTRDTSLARYLRARTLDAGHEVMTAILTRAAQRGEINPDRLTPRIVALPVTLTLYETMASGQPPSPAALTEIVDDLFLPLVTT